LSSCPVCGKATRLEEFREEAIGEVWTGQAAVWAEEGVCADCYRDVLPSMLRPWTQEEWLSHHFESWRAQTQKVGDVKHWEESVEESWLPAEERVRLVDVAGTLDRRREHLARAASAMKDLLARYPIDGAPPPFQAVLEGARAALSDEAVAALKGEREKDEERLRLRRLGSLVDTPAPVIEDPPWDERAAGPPPPPLAAGPAAAAARAGLPWGPMIAVGALVLLLIWWLLG
jgi:hypothetical protein